MNFYDFFMNSYGYNHKKFIKNLWLRYEPKINLMIIFVGRDNNLLHWLQYRKDK